MTNSGKRIVVCPSPTGRDADLRFGSEAGDLLWANLSYAWAHRLADAWNGELARLERIDPRDMSAEGEPMVLGVDW